MEFCSEFSYLVDGERCFRAESSEKSPGPGEKFFGNFPFPYMNVFLHLGHAFSHSKLEFAAAYHRLRGANVLLPFAFHCTCIPIKAAVDTLAWEINQFGNPPSLSKGSGGVGKPRTRTKGTKCVEAAMKDKFRGKKSEAAAKSEGDKYFSGRLCVALAYLTLKLSSLRIPTIG
ncbi:hypothetical protein MLD38_005749 [Melastoma candidum]|uniref:Uncharacterized protein n=1 Tax=Melastoma candidum TaxID=119954 RepID=A0ACB9RKP7_9MYRT|nr:hypothetical protein MLD38_005749 [Melastoma candidum]